MLAAGASRSGLRERVRRVIFEADTTAGKTFDVGLLVLIALSVVAVMLETVEAYDARYGDLFMIFEWGVTIVFTFEYAARLWCSEPLRYARSFFGIIDLLAIVPTYASLLFPGAHSLIVIRAFRLLRIARIFKLARYTMEENVLLQALRSSAAKVIVFLQTVIILAVVLGSAIYLLEGGEAGFTSIPQSIYWAVVTVTTVGYGDVVPRTVAGKVIAAAAMIIGYSIIAVPTGIVSAELVHATRRPISTRSCPSCTSEGHMPAARFCRDCGAELAPSEPSS